MISTLSSAGSAARGAVFAVVLLLTQCNSPERDNPFDPAALSGEPETGQTLTLLVQLPKSLASVIDSIVAKLVAPGMREIVKELDQSPLGPAILTIGAISPGPDRTLTIEGYDIEGRLIMVGEQRNITIVIGDTTRVTINLTLTDEFVPFEPDDAADDGADAGTDGEATAGESADDGGGDTTGDSGT